MLTYYTQKKPITTDWKLLENRSIHLFLLTFSVTFHTDHLVWSLECRVWSVEFGVWSVEFGVWSLEREMKEWFQL